jgi:hypothetical protein
VNCTVIQRRLLSAEQPEHPPGDIKSHLAQCPSCRAWQRRLVQMERQITQLPIPPSTAKEQFLQRIVGPRPADAQHPTIADPAMVWRSTLIPGPKERGLRKLSLAFALAASLLVFALAWWSWPRNTVVPPDPVKIEQAKLDQRLSSILSGETPKERVLLLTKLAEEVHGEARALVEQSERLEQRARFYSRVVGEHLFVQAQQLPPEERPAVLKEVAQRLTIMESEASRLAAQLKQSPRSAAAFQQIALASQKGERNIRALTNG